MPRGKRHYRIKLEDVLEAHAAALKRGGRPGILNLASIQSAIGRPYAGYCPQVWKKGAALFESLCRNHGFTDGNKRTAVVTLLLLLDRSGYELAPVSAEDINDAIARLAISVANGELNRRAIEDWLRARIIAV